MAFKHLSRFTLFDIDGFLKGKTLLFTGQTKWTDYDTGKENGTKVEATIVKDNTNYGDTEITNLYEKLIIKIKTAHIDIPKLSVIRLVNPHGTVYGEYRNQLSVTAEGIEVIPKKA